MRNSKIEKIKSYNSREFACGSRHNSELLSFARYKHEEFCFNQRDIDYCTKFLHEDIYHKNARQHNIEGDFASSKSICKWGSTAIES